MRKELHYYADFVMFDNVIVETKASGCNVGNIINFAKRSIEYKRLVP